jgi:CRP-like cAMP-binding protein
MAQGLLLSLDGGDAMVETAIKDWSRPAAGLHLRRRSPQTDLVAFSAGDFVYRQGDAGDWMYLIVSGTVQIVKELAGLELEIHLLEPGDFFGQDALLQAQPRTASVKAWSDVKLLRIDKQQFENLLQLDVEIPIRMLRQLTRSLQMAERRLDLVLTQLSEPERVQSLSQPVDLTGERVMGAAVAELVLDGGKQRWPVWGKVLRLGRRDKVTGITPEVDLSDVPERNSVSRFHARLVYGDGGFELVEEPGVKNGTTVNGCRLEPGVPVRLKEGDRLGLGSVNLRFSTRLSP